jgi:hypothetical protein|tara:strand:+ start:1013 stop:1255 length:243 start_codon:yes stop_codon:yes gene_type:complete
MKTKQAGRYAHAVVHVSDVRPDIQGKTQREERYGGQITKNHMTQMRYLALVHVDHAQKSLRENFIKATNGIVMSVKNEVL